MRILFVCKGNMFRSQMAEAIAGQIIGPQNVMSAGTYTGAPDEPEGQVLKNLFPTTPTFLEFMNEMGLDISDKKTKKIKQEMIDWADVVIDMAEEPYDLEILKNNPKVKRWELPNDARKTKENFATEFVNIAHLIESLE